MKDYKGVPKKMPDDTNFAFTHSNGMKTITCENLEAHKETKGKVKIPRDWQVYEYKEYLDIEQLELLEDDKDDFIIHTFCSHECRHKWKKQREEQQAQETDEFVKSNSLRHRFINNKKTYIYQFNVLKYIEDRRRCGIPEDDIQKHVDLWALGYDNKITDGTFVFDNNNMGIPAFKEWCDIIGKKVNY